MAKTPKPENEKTKLRLYGKADETSNMYFTQDQTSKDDLETCQEIIDKALNLNASKSVLIRRAIACYRSFLEGLIIDSMKTEKGCKTPDLSRFMELLEAERGDIFKSAGRYDSERYNREKE